MESRAPRSFLSRMLFGQEWSIPMDASAASLPDHHALHETAARLIKALGKESAIFVCRSNYWHGVLRLIEDQPVHEPAS